MRPEREPADWAAERQTIRRLGEALLLAPTTDLFNALQVALDAVTEALDAAERRTDTEWLGQRGRGAVAVLHAIASQVIQS